jgi:hypothetical protein
VLPHGIGGHIDQLTEFGYGAMMSETTDIEPRDRGGRFVKGGIPGPGRPRGARSALSETFLRDLAECWQTHGKTALEQCAITEPSMFCRIVSTLLPKQSEVDVDVTVLHEVGDTLALYRRMAEMLGVDAKVGLRQLRRMDTIDADA